MTQDLTIGNLLTNLPCAHDAEQIQPLVTTNRVRIERIVSAGQITPEGRWYDQAWDEWVAVLQGSATLEFDDDQEDLTLAVGDWVLLPAGCRHRVYATSSDPACLWLAVHTS
jgi:cupin 2 domain-containing protein